MSKLKDKKQSSRKQMQNRSKGQNAMNVLNYKANVKKEKIQQAKQMSNTKSSGRGN